MYVNVIINFIFVLRYLVLLFVHETHATMHTLLLCGKFSTVFDIVTMTLDFSLSLLLKKISIQRQSNFDPFIKCVRCFSWSLDSLSSDVSLRLPYSPYPLSADVFYEWFCSILKQPWLRNCKLFLLCDRYVCEREDRH